MPSLPSVSGPIPIQRLPVKLGPDPQRTVIRPFLPSDPAGFARPGRPRPGRIVARVLSLPEAELDDELARVRASLDARHREVDALLLRQFDAVRDQLPDPDAVTHSYRLLIGAYLSAEYAFESAALFNPSIVGVGEAADGAIRFVLSLRGIGEGHLSSVAFRTGCWQADGTLALDPASETAVPPIVGPATGWHDQDTVQLDCSGSREPSETVLFPVLDSQARGIEDLRLTPFRRKTGEITYVGTYTAVGADAVRQELIQTDDFRNFKMHPVRGALAGAKGMALFPRRVGGRFLAIGRQDNENLWLFGSDDPFTWNGGRKILEPRYPWEFVQIGNCGSPIEIDEGWLLLTHGVGVVRNYCMGAVLLDKDDPSRVLGRLPMPLLEPGPEDRDGYVPNVVYSCGALVRGRTMLLPYGIADEYTRFATIPIDPLLAAMDNQAL